MTRPNIACPAPPPTRNRLIPRVLLYFALLCCQPALSAPPALDLPIRCSLGQDCFIQNYVDRDTSPDWSDYACGHLSYDRHTGTDFRLHSMVAMHQGVAVIAAAEGIVTGLRDNESDTPVLTRSDHPESGKHAAGNSVIINHGDGWETQYSHMKKGSVAVRLGQQVHVGDLLGMVGLSGNTEFPHLELTVLHNGQPVDPFNPSTNNTCNSTGALWKPEVLKILRYVPTGLVLSGWAHEAPNRDKAQNGEYPEPKLTATALVFWVELFGVQIGDRQTYEIFTPHGMRILSRTSVIRDNHAAWFGYAGKTRPPHGWPTGTYRADYRLTRNGVDIVTTTRYLTLR